MSSFRKVEEIVEDIPQMSAEDLIKDLEILFRLSDNNYYSFGHLVTLIIDNHKRN
jgi:hypothetical protein